MAGRHRAVPEMPGAGPTKGRRNASEQMVGRVRERAGYGVSTGHRLNPLGGVMRATPRANPISRSR